MNRISYALTAVLAATLFLSGCVTTSQPDVSNACAYKERDLTLPWSQRAYWCVPHQQVVASPTREGNE